ncbi:MAG: CCC motif membrane protein [Bacteroidota bacterium]
MEPENNPPFSSAPFNQPQTDLPNATAILVCGILSIPCCMCYGVLGMILGIVAVVLGNKALKLYNASPGSYTESSIKNTRAGRVCGIIGLSLGAFYLVLTVIFIVTGVSAGIMEEIMRSSGN